jgi:diguanylate cyclase (GGDEF)-like protein
MRAIKQSTHAEHWIVKVNHKNRSVSFLMLFAIIGSHMVSRDYSLLAWSLFALLFLVYPHLVYWLARRARDSKRAEFNSLMVDSLLFGVSAAALAFPLWISFTLFISVIINNAIFRSKQGVWQSVVAIALGALGTTAVTGLHLSPSTDWPTTALCISGLSFYLIIVADVAYLHIRKLHEARVLLRQREQALLQHLGEIEQLQTQLQEQANRDPLTGLYNRRYLVATLPRELARCQREGKALSLMLIDIDHFKQVNDRYGHPAGDEVLKKLAAMLNENARAGDIACRYGGEEFLLVLPHMAQADALERSEQWRATFAATTVAFDALRIQASLSFGIASFPEHGTSPEELIRCADRALYQAKAQGRNRVVMFDTAMATPSIV